MEQVQAHQFTPSQELLEHLQLSQTTNSADEWLSENTKYQSPLSDKVVKFLCTLQSPDSFVKGKYKTRKFADVVQEDPQYIKYLIQDCKIYAMRSDRDNLIKWLDINL